MSKKKRANGFGKSCIQKTIPRKRKKERRCLKRQLRSLNNSFLIQEFCFRKNHNDKYENIMPCSNTKMSVDLVKPCTINSNVGGARSGPNLLDKTIDLCSDESSNCVDQLLVSPKPSIENSEVIIDLCGDTSDQNDVIFIDSEELLNKDKKTDTMVVDLSQDDEPIQNKTFTPNDVNDDVLVIGTYKKIPLSTSDSNRINNFVKCVAKINKNTRDSKEKIMLNFDRGRNMKMNYKAEENWRKHLRNNWRKHLPTGSKVGENVYLNSPVNLPKSGLRPIIIDGSNVAFSFGKSHFSCKRLETCIKYFKERGHKVTAFVPQFRTQHGKSDDPELLNRMVESGDVILTPSKRVEGKSIVPYDDRFIVQTAVLKGGIIVTRDNYRDLLQENPAWADTINYRTLAYTWVDDVLMFPKDPLGEHGPKLDEFLRFP